MKIDELWIGLIMRWGLWLSVFIVALGGSWYLMENGLQFIQYGAFQVPHFQWGEFFKFTPEHVIEWGLFILVMTQVLRVFFTLFLFMERKEGFFVIITFFILVVMIYSLFWR